MKEILLKILIVAYGATAIIDIIAYWPTIKDLWIHKKPSANIQSFALWTLATGVSFLYGIFVIQDLLFIIVSGMIFLSNFLILVLSIRLKAKG